MLTWGGRARSARARRRTTYLAEAIVAGLTALVAAIALSGLAPASGRESNAVSLTAPTSATVQIVATGLNSFAFQPADVALALGGTLTVENTTTAQHTFTSVAVGGDGRPLFDVKFNANETKTIPVSDLPDGTYKFQCLIHPEMRGTLTMGAGGPVVSGTFDQPLAQPPRLTGKNIRIVMKKADVQVLPSGPPTPMWTYGGTFPGPTIVRPAGADTKVTFVNHLPRRAGSVTIHSHGGHQASKFDGQPTTFLIKRGRSRTYDYPSRDAGKKVPAALRFYHDHRMNVTARNNWMGLQGMFLTTDPHDAKMGLPHGAFDIPLDFTDRSFNADNTLTNPFTGGVMKHDMASMSGMSAQTMSMADAPMGTVGDQVLVNGRFAPYKEVKPGRYRLRLLNTSLFSAYDFALSDGRTFTQIGTGNGLLPHPVIRQDILLGPAQRADVVVDFRGESGKNVILASVPRTDTANGTGTREAALMEFRVSGSTTQQVRIPSTLTRIAPLKLPRKIAKTWTFGLTTGSNGTFWSINGKRFNPTRVDHKVVLGRTEKWKIRNTTDMTHYVHLHEEEWHTISRDGHRPPPWERGYEDTWRLDPGESVVVAAKFTDYTGDFMIHCHMLDHEDDGMMATFRVVRPRHR